MALKARVQNGRLTLSVPTSLPDGTELELVLDDGKDGMDDSEHKALVAALDDGLAHVGPSRSGLSACHSNVSCNAPPGRITTAAAS
jgi:hypothetical protein